MSSDSSKPQDSARQSAEPNSVDSKDNPNAIRSASVHTDPPTLDSQTEAINAEHRPEKLGRLHPLSLFFDIASHIRTFIIPAIIAAFSAASDSIGGVILAGFIFIPTLVASVVRYFSLRYRIRESELIVTEGIFFRRIRTVPIVRIQNIDLIQNVLHRALRVAEVRIETASGTEPEAILRVLSMRKIEELRTAIFQSRNQNESLAAEDGETIGDPVPSQAETLHTIPSNLLIRAGLASNKGTLLLGVLIGLFFQFDDQLKDYFDLNDFLTWFRSQYDTATMIFLVVVAIVLALVFFRILGIAWYLLRFSGYRLSRNNDDLRIECGLFTKVSATVPRKRIQFISIHRNWIMRWMKLASIRIETAGAAGNGREDAAKTVSSRWFIPVISELEVKRLIEELRPGLIWNEDDFDWQPVSPLAAKRMARLEVFTALIIAGVGFAITRPWGWMAGLVVLPLLVWMAIRRAKSRRYARTENVIVYRSGLLTKKTSLTFFEKIQTVLVSETPFDRRWKMATLTIDTAAAGPAGHLIQIDYLQSDFAKSEFAEIVQHASDKLPVFA